MVGDLPGIILRHRGYILLINRFHDAPASLPSSHICGIYVRDTEHGGGACKIMPEIMEPDTVKPQLVTELRKLL